MRWRPVMHYVALEVGFLTLQMMSGGTFPDIEGWLVGETSLAITFRPVMGVTRNEFQYGRHPNQKQSVRIGQENFSMKIAEHVPPVWVRESR
jgi:hypothetical protein